LVANFVYQACQQFQKPLKKISSSAKALFLDYPWPGNIRELKGVIESAVMVSDGDYVTISDLPMNLQHYATGHRAEIGPKAIRIAWLRAAGQPIHAQVEDPRRTSGETGEILLCTAPRESSALAGTVPREETLPPMAESLGTGGAKPHLVKTKSGLVGWIKANDTDESKKLESFFKSLPAESFSIPTDIPEA